MKIFYNNLWEKWDKIDYIKKLIINFFIGFIIICFSKNLELINLYLVVVFSWIFAIIFYSIHLEKEEKKKERERETNSLAKTKEEDELYNKAKKIVINSGKSSAAFLQRNLNIGYASAAKLQEALEEKGVIGKHNGTNQRDVFVKKEE